MHRYYLTRSLWSVSKRETYNFSNQIKKSNRKPTARVKNHVQFKKVPYALKELVSRIKRYVPPIREEFAGNIVAPKKKYFIHC